MSQIEWVHAGIGGLASVIFLFQTLSNADTDVDDAAGGDYATDHFSSSLSDYLSVRNLVAFFIGYGWVTFAGLLSGKSFPLSAVFGIIAGLVFVWSSLVLLKTFLKFQENGNLNMESLVGASASVYILIGPAGSSQGKIMVDTQKGRQELPARTHDEEKLVQGDLVTIVSNENGVLWVTKQNS